MQVMVEKEAEDFLEKAGFRVTEREFASSPAIAIRIAHRLSYPVALKVVSKKVLHKSDVGGVALDVKSDGELKREFVQMKKIKGFEGVLVQDYKEGLFVLLGIKKDPAFGHVVTVGAGGVFTEVMRDVSFRACPLTKSDALSMVKELKMYKILQGYRGKKYAVDKLLKMVLLLSALAKKFPAIEELDINPLILEEKEATVVDARIVFAD